MSINILFRGQEWCLFYCNKKRKSPAIHQSKVFSGGVEIMTLLIGILKGLLFYKFEKSREGEMEVNSLINSQNYTFHSSS